MYRMWLWFDPRQALVGLHVFLFALAVIIHLLLLSTDRFNWLQSPGGTAAEVQQNSALPS